MEAWLSKRVARNRQARYALRLLQRLETLGDFGVVGLGIGTHHNATMDYLTRAKSEEASAEMERLGFQEVDLRAAWDCLLAGVGSDGPVSLGGAAGPSTRLR